MRWLRFFPLAYARTPEPTTVERLRRLLAVRTIGGYRVTQPAKRAKLLLNWGLKRRRSA